MFCQSLNIQLVICHKLKKIKKILSYIEKNFMSLVYTSVFYNKRNISCIQLTSRMNENIIAYPISSKFF